MEVWPGRPFPLGATWDGQGTNFSLFSEHAEAVELCLFGDDGEETRIAGVLDAIALQGAQIIGIAEFRPQDFEEFPITLGALRADFVL